jgi:MOSC domain-containing protein YiiM
MEAAVRHPQPAQALAHDYGHQPLTGTKNQAPPTPLSLARTGHPPRRHGQCPGSTPRRHCATGSEASRRALEAALGDRVDLRRFRTNLHLELDAAPFAEERLQGGHLRVGQVTLALLHPCARCVIPTRNPDHQGRWPELLRFLHRARAGLFGINARVLTPGRLAVGDRARML